MNEFSVKFEADVQRQYERYGFPLKCSLAGEEYDVIDWSLDGIGINTGSAKLAVGSISPIKLLFPFDSYSFAIDLLAEVIYTNQDGRTGLQYRQVGTEQMRLMRYVRDSILKGEMLVVGEIIDLNKRAAEAKPRKDNAEQNLSGGERASRLFSRILGFLLVGVLVLAALAFVGASLYQRMAVVSASSAFISTDLTPFYSPTAGIVTFVAQGTVGNGEPLVTIQPPTGLSQTIMSSCDCVVEESSVALDTQARTGQQLLTLRAADAAPYVVAMVPSSELANLYRGASVEVELVDGTTITGGSVASIPNLSVDSTGKSVPVRIDLGANAANAQVGEPADVRFYKNDVIQLPSGLKTLQNWFASAFGGTGTPAS